MYFERAITAEQRDALADLDHLSTEQTAILHLLNRVIALEEGMKAQRKLILELRASLIAKGVRP